MSELKITVNLPELFQKHKRDLYKRDIEDFLNSTTMAEFYQAQNPSYTTGQIGNNDFLTFQKSLRELLYANDFIEWRKLNVCT